MNRYLDNQITSGRYYFSQEGVKKEAGSRAGISLPPDTPQKTPLSLEWCGLIILSSGQIIIIRKKF
jgi:hypothetical protein